MAHFALTWPGGLVNLTVVPAAQWNDLDLKTSKAINGDDGGTWAPSSPIVIGGQGLNCPSLAAWSVDGSLRIDSGGVISMQAGALLDFTPGAALHLGSGAGISMGAGSFITMAAGSIGVSATGQITIGGGGGLSVGAGGVLSVSAGGVLSVAAGGVLSIATADLLQLGGANQHPKFTTARARWIGQPLQPTSLAADWAWFAGLGFYVVMPSSGTSSTFALTNLQDGALFDLIQVGISGTPHSGPPVNPPRLTVNRLNMNTSAIDPLTAAPFDLTNLVMHGGFSTLNVPLTQNNVIDKSTYVYFVTVSSESGANAGSGSELWPMNLHCSNIVDQRPF